MSVAEKLQVVANNLSTENEVVTTQEVLLQQIRNALEGKTGTMGGLDTSDATAAADDIFYKKTAYVNGKKVEGTMPIAWGGITAETVPEANGGGMPYVKMQYDVPERRVLDPDYGGGVTLTALYESFGDASTDDVAAGKTFTSAAGFQVVGTGSGGDTEAAYNQGYKDGGSGVLSYATNMGRMFYKAVFPEGTELELYVPNFAGEMDWAFKEITGLEKLTLRCDNTEGTISCSQTFWGTSIKILDISQWKRTLSAGSMYFAQASDIVTIIGALDLSLATLSNNFSGATKLEDVTFVPNTIKISISFVGCSKLSNASIQSIVDGLADLTGEIAQTLTLHATVGAKLTDAQKASATAKNWTLAY